LSHSREGVTRISLSLPPELLTKFDEISAKAGFTDRSKAIQSTMRDFITEQAQTASDDTSLAGTLQIMYDHEAAGVDSALTDLEHHGMKIISSSLHVHMDSRRCLKIIVLRGRYSEIRSFQKNIRNLKGVLQLKLSLLETETD